MMINPLSLTIDTDNGFGTIDIDGGLGLTLTAKSNNICFNGTLYSSKRFKIFRLIIK